MSTTSPGADAPFADLLSGGDRRTLRNCEAVVGAVLAEPERAEELIACITGCDDESVRMRAADALEKACRERPAVVQPHVDDLLGDMARIDQPSVRWHLAQILPRLDLKPAERAHALALLRDNLDSSADWIVLNCSLDGLAAFARRDPTLVDALVAYLERFQASPLRSVASRSRRLLREFAA